MKTTFQIAPPSERLEKIGYNGRIGLVALATDLTSESDLRTMAPAGVEIFTNRVHNHNPLTVENLRAMAPDITRASSGILPGEPVDVLIYACTSGTTVIGEARVFELLRAGQRDNPCGEVIPCTTPITAALAALRKFGAQRVSILTPYVEAINRELAKFLQDSGIEVLNVRGFGIADDTDMAGVSYDSIVQGAVEACAADADALFISCTALRAAQVVARIEAKIGKPVVTSNQAMLWHALKLLRCEIALRGFGKLFDLSEV